MKRVSPEKTFVAYFYCNGADLSLGISVNFERPNIEIYVPFGFFRIGWNYKREICEEIGKKRGYKFLYRSWGLKGNTHGYKKPLVASYVLASAEEKDGR